MESVDQPVVVPQKGSLAGDRSEAFEGRSKARAARAGYGRVKKTREIPNRRRLLWWCLGDRELRKHKEQEGKKTQQERHRG